MQFRDLRAQYGRYREEIDRAIGAVLERADFIGGKEVYELEERLADYVGVKHCISCANGTEAMSLVLLAWGVGAGDAVFVPDFTFFSSGEVVSFCGAEPVFVDVDRHTFNMNPLKLKEAVEKVRAEGSLKAKVVIAVDLFGLPANYPQILKVAQEYELLVLEDAAQAFGGRIGEQRAGSFGTAATTSFFPAKPLGCYGDGGAVFTDDRDLAELIGSLKVHGKGNSKYDNVRIGVNSRLDTLQAAVLLVKLKALVEEELEAVERVYRAYHAGLQDLVEVPLVPDGYYSSWAQYTIKLPERALRDGLQQYLKEGGVPSAIYYQKPMHRQAVFSDLNFEGGDFAVTNELCEIVLSLPMHPYLKESDIEKVCERIKHYQAVI